MEKQIFIPIKWLKLKTTYCIDSFIWLNDERKIDTNHYFIVLGVVNHFLNDKANCREIVRVSHCQQSMTDGARIYIGSLGIWEGFIEGFLITYLESNIT